jgi:rubrerythrin
MPTFSNPFVDNVPSRKMTTEELIRAMRINLSAEEDATALYMAHAEATDNPVVRKVLIDIANEERVHVGEFNELINILTNYEEDAWIQNGVQEVREMAEEVARGELEVATPAEKAAEEAAAEAGGNGHHVTIGSLKE